MTPASVLPPIVVLPLGALTLLVIGGHLIALRAAAGMPNSRRRIRTACGVVMMLTTCSLAHAFGYVRTDDPRLFTLAWTMAVMLLALVLALAGLDAINNLRLARLQRRRIRRVAHELHRQIARAMGEQAPPQGAGEAGVHGGPRITLRDGRGDDPGS